MKLVKLKVKNFRCYKEEVELEINNLTCLIGKNDHGKSTLLEALNAFFNENIDKGDLSVDPSGDTIEITCTFSDTPSEMILDTSIETSLYEEGLLNIDRNLEIKKFFKIGATIQKSTWLCCHHPFDKKLDDILSLKNGSLKALAAECKIDLTGINLKENSSLRKVIRESINADRKTMFIKVDGNLTTENNLKSIWPKIRAILPIYSLFKVDKTIDDKDKDVQDPMKVAIKETLSTPEIKELLEKIEEEVRAKSTEVAERTIEKLKEIDPSLAEKLKSDFNKLPGWAGVFDLTLMNDKNIPLNKRGSGVKRLVLLSFFQAQAEKRKNEEDAPSIIYAIEEPETSQHPNHQKILIKSLIELSERENVQVLFTTHSANLSREIPIESLILIQRDEDVSFIEYGYDKTTKTTNEETLNKIIHSLGILPNPHDKVDTLLFLEGINDIDALCRYSSIFNSYNEKYINLTNNHKIAFVLTGGSSLKYYVDKKFLDQLGKPQVHIYDNDVPEYIIAVKQLNKEGGLKKGFNTTKLMMENYLHHEAIQEAYAENGLIVVIPEITDDMNVPLEVAKAVYEASSEDANWEKLKDENKKKKISNVKKMLNIQAVEKMTIERIKYRNSFDDIHLWLTSLN